MFARTCRALALLILAGCGTDSTGPGAPVATIELEALGDVWVGDVRVLQATPRSSDGAALNRKVITWFSTQPTVASVDASGQLSAIAIGTTTITATSEGKQAEITISVSDLDLIYEGFLGGFSEMLVLSLNGTQPARVLPAGVLVTSPAPSPDGSKIAFVPPEIASPDHEIYVVNRDGTGVLQLTNTPEIDDHPAWSPDGTKIAFRSFRAQRFGDIWVMNADGSNPVNLTPDPQDTTAERRPAWSPDGTHIAFSSNRSGTFDIWTMRADGTDLRQITNTRDFDTEPTWSPDGRLAFRRSDDFTSDLMVIGLQGGPATRLVFSGHELMPAWSPNGKFIAFAYFGPNGGPPQIHTVRPDGSDLTLRTTEPAWKGGISPQWIRR